MYRANYKSPLGNMHICASKDALISIDWCDDLVADNGNEVTEIACLQLDEYFTGKRKVFDLPVAPEGTEFQQRAWKILQTIPYAQTISYGAQAKKLGNVKAVRAIGAANGKNPISIIVPCHRVVGANGRLTGYAGGLERKEFLLKHEAICVK